MSMYPKFGILILGYNRPRVLEQTIRTLSSNSNLQDASLFLSLDAPKNIEDSEPVRQSQEAFAELINSRINATRLFSSSHQGLRGNVIQSVSTAFETVERLLVLEDDCQIGESTISFFNWGFNELERNPIAGALSGSYFGRAIKDTAYLGRRFSSWGWGTEKAIWSEFLHSRYLDMSAPELSLEILRLSERDPRPYRWEYQRISKKLSSLDSWAIPFDFFLRSRNLRTIKPAVNQIRNVGFGDGATHTGRGSSLSIKTGYVDVSKIRIANPRESWKLEKLEARAKVGKLACELLLSKIPKKGDVGNL